MKHTLPSKKIFGIKIVRYRIITDLYLGYECQKWVIWCPFWFQIRFSNTHPSIEKAIDYINQDFKGWVVLQS